MRRHASHTINNGIVFDVVDIPAALNVNIEVSASRVHSLHGSEASARYRHFFSRALAALATSDATGHDRHALIPMLGALAAWRAGTVEIRVDALRRLDAHLDDAHPESPALAAALGLAPADLPAFVTAQKHSHFGWPPFGAGEHVVAFLGGFAGLDGPWIAPPDAVAAGDEPGTFLLRAGDELWRADCDIFGTRLVRADHHTGQDAVDDRTFAPEADGAPENGDLTSRLSVSEYEYIAVLTAVNGVDRHRGAVVPSDVDTVAV